MQVTIVATTSSPHQMAHAKAMVSGLKAIGLSSVIAHSHHGVQTRLVVCWGWRQGQIHRQAGRDVLVMERGYIGDRFAWTSLAWNGLNNRGAVPAAPEDGGARFCRHFDGLLKPWNPAGDYVLLIGQVPGDMSLQGRDLRPWYIEQARMDWGMPVMFRPHPLGARRGAPIAVPGAATLTGDLQDALRGAAHVITWNSNTGVDALLAGKPVAVSDAGSMAWNVTREGREAWAYRLAWRQWRMEEIADGSALRHVWR